MREYFDFRRRQHHEHLQRQDIDHGAGGQCRRIGRQADQRIGGGEDRDQGGILILKGPHGLRALTITVQTRAQIMLARTVGGKRLHSRARRMATQWEDRGPASLPSRDAETARHRPARKRDCRASPSTRPCGAVPNQVGLPGRTAIFSTAISAPAASTPAGHGHGRRPKRRRSPPADRCPCKPCFRRARDGADIVFFHRQAIGHSAPGLDQPRNAKGAGVENLKGSGSEPGAASSSPLLRIAMRGARVTAHPPRRMPPPATAPRRQACGPP